jgi:chromosome partitioning protein
VAASRIADLLPGDIGPTGRPLPAFPQPKELAEHGPARIVAICNQKGGVGKTTTTINLGAALAEQGRKMLLVDFDPQGALSVGLGIQPHDIDLTVYNLLMERDVKARDVISPTGIKNLDLLPSNIVLSGAEVQLVSEVGREFVLGRALKSAVPRPADDQRACLRQQRAHPAGVRVLRDAGRGPAHGDHRQGAAATQPGPGD